MAYFKTHRIVLFVVKIITIIEIVLSIIGGIAYTIYAFISTGPFGFIPLFSFLAGIVAAFFLLKLIDLLIKDYEEASEAIIMLYDKLQTSETTKEVIRVASLEIQKKDKEVQKAQTIEEINPNNIQVNDKVVFKQNVRFSPYDSREVQKGTEGVVINIFQEQPVVKIVYHDKEETIKTLFKYIDKE